MSKDSMQLVHILWKDSSSRQGGIWHDRDDVETLKPITIISIGWVVKETKKKITIAAHFGSHQCGGDMCIPKSCIKKIRKIKL